MLECLIIGDSIAVGTAIYRPECETRALGGINTWQFNRRWPGNFVANTVIISLGSNDHRYVKTRKELEQVRDRTKAARVFWILPAGNLKGSEVPIESIQSIVESVAQEHGDTVINITRLQPDKIHPSAQGYKDIAAKTR